MPAPGSAQDRHHHLHSELDSLNATPHTPAHSADTRFTRPVNVQPNPTRGDQPKPYDSSGISWTRPSPRLSSTGLLGNMPPAGSSSSPRLPAADGGRDKMWSVRRWQGLVSNSLRQMQREGWRGRERLSRASGTGSVQHRLQQSALDILSALWIVEPEQPYPKPHAHTPDSEDVKPPLGAGGIPPGTPGVRSAGLAPGARPAQVLSRTGYIVLILLFLLGLKEMVSFSSATRRPIDHNSIAIGRGRDPFAVLRDFAPISTRPAAASLPGVDRTWMSGMEAVDVAVEQEQGDTTAIVLHWKRTDNVEVIVAHLCRYAFFRHVIVWNNNPDIFLTRDALKRAKCPADKLRIYNSPRNMLFVARYLACTHAETPNCFFQDDDWLVQPLRALYSQFSRDPEGPVLVHTNSGVSTLYALEWCFFQKPLQTCFAWMGTGAFVAKSHVQRFLAATSEIGYPRDEVGHTDNSFATFLNNPPYVMSGPLSQLPQPWGHSDGAGIARNKAFIQKGLVHMSKYFGVKYSANLAAPLPSTPLAIDTAAYHRAQTLPLAPHPYARHARSPCASDSCVFLTNIAQLPPPDSVPYPGPDRVKLEEWENHLGHNARGWMEGNELFNEEEAWATRWPYSAAVDEDPKTAFRSPDVVQRDDWVGLGLLEPIEVSWIPRVRLHAVLEDSDQLLDKLKLEVSTDGYSWSAPQETVSAPRCSSFRSSSTLPEPTLPKTYLSSAKALALIAAEGTHHNFLSRWWTRRRRRGRGLTECQFELSSKAGGSTAAAERVGLEGGWRFVRLRSEVSLNVGWGVYELWVGPAQGAERK